jgi:hypothetical protein
LQSILAMPFVLSGASAVGARGVRHDLAFTADPVTAEPTVEHERSEFGAKVPHGHWKPSSPLFVTTASRRLSGTVFG